MAHDADGPPAPDEPPDAPGDASRPVLEVATSEAHRTLDEQLDTLEDIDGKAHQLLQFTTALLGVVGSIISFTGLAAVESAMPYLGVGLMLLVAGVMAAGVTYTVSARVAGIGPTALEAATDMETERVFRRTLVRSYADWIRFNAAVNTRAAFLITVAILFVIAGALGLALGLVRSLVGPLPTAVVAVAGLAFLVVAYGVGIHRQFSRVRAAERGQLIRPAPAVESVFPGQLCTKGDVDGEPDVADSATDD